MASPSKPKVPGVVPSIISTNCQEHIKWIKTVFRAEQHVIHTSDDSKKVLHCSLCLNGGYLYLCDEIKEFSPRNLEDEPAGFILGMEMEQISDSWNRGTANGATVVKEIQKEDCGHLFGSFKDPFGFVWGLKQVAAADSCKPGVLPYVLHDGDCNGHVQWMVNALDAVVKGEKVEDGKMQHCFLEINGSTVLVGDTNTHPVLKGLVRKGKMTHLTCHLELSDPYPVWDKILKNGGKPSVDLKVQFWGSLYGSVGDAMGLEWSVSKIKPKEAEPSNAGVTPYILSLDCEQHIDWVQKVFGEEVKEIYRTKTQKIMHCRMGFNGGQLFLCDRSCGPNGEDTPISPGEKSEGVVLHVSLPDPDLVWKKAMDNKAEQVEELKQQFWGGYYGCLRDPYGVQWGIIKT